MFKRNNIAYIFVSILSLALSSCTNNNPSTTQDFPKTKDEIQDERVGKLLKRDVVLWSNTGQNIFTDLNKGNNQSNNQSTPRNTQETSVPQMIRVNPYLWKAALDVMSFMPLATVDGVNGIITTEWYQIDNSINEKYKFNILIYGTELRPDHLRVSVFKEEVTKKDWKAINAPKAIHDIIEHKILDTARKMKFDSSKKR